MRDQALETGKHNARNPTGVKLSRVVIQGSEKTMTRPGLDNSSSDKTPPKPGESRESAAIAKQNNCPDQYQNIAEQRRWDNAEGDWGRLSEEP